jgi:hypothetical protein
MSQPKVKFPEASDTERALQDEQIQLLRDSKDLVLRQIMESGLLSPDLYREIGWEPITRVSDRVPQLEKEVADLKEKAAKSPTTKHYARDLREKEAELALARNEITGFKRVQDPMDKQRREIEQGYLDRSSAALRGELPADPALLRDLREQEQTLGNIMRRNLGSGWQASSPGIEALVRFGESANIQKDMARREDMTMAEALGISREQSNAQRINQLLQRSLALAGRDTGQAGALLQGANQYNPIIGQMFANRQGQFGARALNFQYDAYANPFTWQGAYRNLQQDKSLMAGMISTIKAKKDVEPLDKDGESPLKMLRDTPHYRWKYRWEGDDQPKHIGPIYELSPKTIKLPDDRISLGDYLGVTAAAVKELDRDVQALKEARR